MKYNNRNSKGFMFHNPANGYGNQDSVRFNGPRHPGSQYSGQVSTYVSSNSFND